MPCVCARRGCDFIASFHTHVKNAVFFLSLRRANFYFLFVCFVFVCARSVPCPRHIKHVCNETWILISVIFHKISWYTLNYDNLQFHFITQRFLTRADEEKPNEFARIAIGIVCMWICNFYWESSAFQCCEHFQASAASILRAHRCVHACRCAVRENRGGKMRKFYCILNGSYMFIINWQ